jgi:pimeloyl-ACP methyl ester carboxylesterase
MTPHPAATAVRSRLWAALFATLGILAPTLEARAAAGQHHDSSPLGRLVSVGDHRLHLYCTGTGSPTVVLEAGMGGNHLDWIRAQPQISKATRVCSYDRAGYGWSDPGPKPRTAEQIATELSLLLRNAEIRGPIVLVGHSFGGILSLYYARRFPGQVAGLVLVDSMHPDQFQRFRKAGVDVPAEPTPGMIHASPELLTFGIPEAYRNLALRLARKASARSFMFSELRNIRESMVQVNEAAQLRPLRAEVIVHGRREWDRLYRDGRMENLWTRLQADLARQIGAVRLVVADRSGHQIPLEDPALVDRMVRSVIQDARRPVN